MLQWVACLFSCLFLSRCQIPQHFVWPHRWGFFFRDAWQTTENPQVSALMWTKAQVLFNAKLAQHSLTNIAFRALSKVDSLSKIPFAEHHMQPLCVAFNITLSLFRAGFIYGSGRQMEILQNHNRQHISSSDCSSVFQGTGFSERMTIGNDVICTDTNMTI